MSSTQGRAYVQSTTQSSAQVRCKLCQRSFSARGIKSHEGSCSRKREKKRRDKEFADIAAQVVEAQRKEHRKDKRHLRNGHKVAVADTTGPSQPVDDQHANYDIENVEGADDNAFGDVEDGVMSIGGDSCLRSGSDTSMLTSRSAVATAVPIACDTFKTEYHPNSGRAPAIETFSTFGHPVEAEASSTPIVDNTPWQPFTCRADFEFAELAHQAALNKDQTDKMLQLIWQIAEGQAKFTFRSHTEVSKAWDRAATQMTTFEKHVISVPYKKEEIEFDVHTRPLWDWAMDLLQDPLLAPHFVWDAQRLYKHDGTDFKRFIHEPWTADRWWRIQSSLPNNGVPFAFILYADKTHLTSSGHVKAYPVIARCANLPIHIRNSDGIGGGRVVGWLPIVPTDSNEDGKLNYTNMKRVVWHKAFIKLLESIILYSKTGFAHRCFDAIMRWLYPLILLLSADYEEQCVMALIRGLHSNCPCPVCCIPSTKLSDLNATYPTRTVEDAKAFLELYLRDRIAGAEVLKVHGLRPIANALWEVNNSDPHETLSFDPLHVNDIGNWGNHLFGELKVRAKALGREAEAKIDKQFEAFPRWRDLNHFKSVMTISFSDGNKLRDIAKQMLYSAQNVLKRSEDPVGYALMQCIGSYLRLTMYIALDVHTEATLTAGEAELRVFGTCLHAYIDIQGEDLTKNWNFPKVHALTHAFPDIRAKGAVRNFSTRPNEKQHGPLKRAYLRQTNRKDVANQVLKLDHISLVSELIRSRISYLDEDRHKRTMSQGQLEDEDTLDDQPFAGHLHIGAPQVPVTLAAVEEGNTSNRAFQDFRKKFTKFLNTFVASNDIPLADGVTWLWPTANDKLQEHRYLKVNYESIVDWKLTTDYLRCNPNFHGCERRDCALIRTLDKDGIDKCIFVRLLFMFKFTVSNHTFELALVLPMDAPTGSRGGVDRDLGLTRLRARPLASSEFISLQSIVRGALLVPDHDHDRDFFLVDLVDTDMFLRAKLLRSF
ncbi:uncharacterized protein F5891DRAFT_1190206 [Suillus fuscotomentosus]|uniref:Uncharacterized protein n=1 Tax=Suillus fuscotomentosus TaxID=1912939 RepID=A0AAD4E637_9AGAM|nr:uncharacterized protein F5891DRAFT_1190206 [Suillus fuscotomentosus]KAG1899028.1 hypothetical protein F5891DRAFT_1190206 [Suillus fuscotomentosus]